MKLPSVKKVQGSILLKFVVIGFLLLLLMIPNSFIQSLINERQGFEAQTKYDVAQTWGSQQTIVGPLLSIPFTEERSQVVDGKTKVYKYSKMFHITPSMLDTDGKMSTTSLKKSIYDIWLYTTDLSLNGNFDTSNLTSKDLESIQWDQAILTLGVTDGHGIEGNITAEVSGTKVEFDPGSLVPSIIPRGVSAQLDLTSTESLTFDVQFSLRGSENIRFVPIASESRVELSSDWHSPGFIGVLSPSERDVRSDGFDVVWESGKFSKNNPDRWIDNAFTFTPSNQESFGVELVEPVNHYQKNFRSTKYAFLILSLTFLVFFFFEIGNGLRFHPVQYLLVGLSLTVFYLLLLSLTEQVGFNLAYGIAAVATLSSILMYTKAMFSSNKQFISLMMILIGLYTYIFVLLQLEAYALLAGSIGVFVILTTIMYLTRRMKYYNSTQDDFPSKPDLA